MQGTFVPLGKRISPTTLPAQRVPATLYMHGDFALPEVSPAMTGWPAGCRVVRSFRKFNSPCIQIGFFLKRIRSSCSKVSEDGSLNLPT